MTRSKFLTSMSRSATRAAVPTILAILLGSAVAPPVTAQSAGGPEPFVLRGAHRSAPVKAARSLRPGAAAALRTPAWQPGDPIREIPRRDRDFQSPRSESTRVQIGADALAGQRSASRSIPNGFTVPVESFAGQGFTGAVPPDTVGAGGRNYFVQAVNNASGTSIRMFDRQGGTLVTFNLADIAPSPASVCSTDAAGDPIVLYDNLADRWFLSEFTWSEDRMCVYVSQTSDPLGYYWVYEFAATDFPDYPKFAVWPDGYYAGTNESDPALYVFDRSAMLDGDPASFQRLIVESGDQLPGFGFEMVVPAGVEGLAPPPEGSPALFLRHNDDELHSGSPNATEDYVEMFELSVDWADAANTSLTGPIAIAVTEFDSDLCESNAGAELDPFKCILQPGVSSVRLDAVREIVMFPVQYRNFETHEAMVGVFSVDVDGNDVAGSRWFELRRSGGGSWTLYQEGTQSLLDGTSRWMASIGMDRVGGIALGYNAASSTSTFPSLRYTGRTAVAPLGTMEMPETELAAGSAANASQRYGDYTSISMGSSDCFFWYTGEYNTSPLWSTWIGTFAFDECLYIFSDDFESGGSDEWTSPSP